MTTTTNDGVPTPAEAAALLADPDFQARVAAAINKNARTEYTSTGRDRRKRDGTDWNIRVTGPDHRSYHTVDPEVAMQVVALLEGADQAVTT